MAEGSWCPRRLTSVSVCWCARKCVTLGEIRGSSQRVLLAEPRGADGGGVESHTHYAQTHTPPTFLSCMCILHPLLKVIYIVGEEAAWSNCPAVLQSPLSIPIQPPVITFHLFKIDVGSVYRSVCPHLTSVKRTYSAEMVKRRRAGAAHTPALIRK